MRKLIFIALSLISVVGNGQGIKISALPQAGSLSGSELTAVVQNGITKKTSVQSIANFGGGGGSQNLQSVTTVGNTTSNNIQLLDSGNLIIGAYGGVLLDNSTSLKEGTFDNGTGGSKGISLNCAVGYELNWQGGHLSSSYNNGTTFYPVIIDSTLQLSGLGGSGSVIVTADNTGLLGKASLNNLAWSLTGNSGTNPATNFIGTTDDVDLYIKRNSLVAGAFTTGGAFNFGDLLGLGEKQKFGITGGVASLQMRRRFEVLDTTTAVLFKVDKAQSRIQLGLNTLPLTDTGYGIGSSSFRVKDLHSLRANFYGAVTIADGTQGAGKVLTSDANGLASWQTLALTDTATLNFGSISANGHEVLTMTVTGAALSDVVSLGIPNVSMNDHASFVAWVSATDTVSVKCFNFDGSSFNPAPGLFTVKVFK